MNHYVAHMKLMYYYKLHLNKKIILQTELYYIEEYFGAIQAAKNLSECFSTVVYINKWAIFMSSIPPKQRMKPESQWILVKKGNRRNGAKYLKYLKV